MSSNLSLSEGDCLDDVVISGISCRLPESDNMQELRDNLMNGIDMVTEDDRRWKPGKTYHSETLDIFSLIAKWQHLAVLGRRTDTPSLDIFSRLQIDDIFIYLSQKI